MPYEEWLKKFKLTLNTSECVEVDKIHSYSMKIKKNICINENIDLKSQKSLERYNKFIKLILVKNPIEYKTSKFKIISREKCIEQFKNIIYLLLGNDKKIDEHLEEFINLITVTNSDAPLDGNVLKYDNITDNTTEYKVNIPKCDNISSIVCLVHEFIHYYSFKYEINNTKKVYYDEILSIFAEKYASYILKGQGSSNIDVMIENIRLYSLKYHYTVITKEIEEYRLLAKKENNDNMYNFYKEFKNFYKTLAESYVLGYIYSNKMLQLYLTDESFKSDLNDLFNKKISLQEILDNYWINLDNKDVFEESKKQLRLIFK